MEWVNGVLKIKIGRKFYYLNETHEILYNCLEYSTTILYKKTIIPKQTINKLYKNNLIFVYKNDTRSAQVIYKVKPTIDNYIKIKQELYYRCLSHGEIIYCYDKEISEGVVVVKCANGVCRDEQSVLNNTCDLFTNKEDINKTLTGVYMGSLIK